MHDQKEADLCVSFSIITCLRHELLKATAGKKARALVNQEFKSKKYGFDTFLVEFVGGVNPRSLYGLNGFNSNKKEIQNQNSEVESALKRLVYPTKFFKEPGWKRMNVIQGNVQANNNLAFKCLEKKADKFK